MQTFRTARRQPDQVEKGLVMAIIAFVAAIAITFVSVKTKGLLASVGTSIPGGGNYEAALIDSSDALSVQVPWDKDYFLFNGSGMTGLEPWVESAPTAEDLALPLELFLID